jgi:hypothetical protein
MTNGLKQNILDKLAIADLFIPFIDHRLRNGIGHNAARYDVVEDKINYKNGTQYYSIYYIEFCDKVVKLYGQLELISLYSNWLQIVIP